MRTLLVLSVAVFSAGCHDRGMDSTPPAASVPDQARHRETIRAQMDDMQAKFMSVDLDGFIHYIHRDVVAMSGGVGKVREGLARELPGMVKTIVSCSVGEMSDVVDDGGRLVAFVPIETTYRYPTGGMLQKTYRIACSEDGGKGWTFLDGQGAKDQETFFRSKFPGLTKRFPFPPCSHERLP